MKKTLLAIVAALLIVPFVLGACDKKKNEPTPAPAPPETQAEQTETEPQAAVDPVAVATELMSNYNKLQFVDTLSLDVDYDVEYWDEYGNLYNLVVDPEFQSIGDIWDLLFRTFTNGAAQEIFPDLTNLGTEEPFLYIYLDDGDDEECPKGLYQWQVYNGFSTYDPNGEIVISEQTDSSFTALVPCAWFTVDTELTLRIVQDNGVWKINSIEYAEIE